MTRWIRTSAIAAALTLPAVLLSAPADAAVAPKADGCIANCGHAGAVVDSDSRPLDPMRDVYFELVQSSGDVRLVLGSGRIVPPGALTSVRLDEGARLATGRDGQVAFQLRDHTIVSLAANTEIKFEDIKDLVEPDPFLLRLIHGTLRYARPPQPIQEYVQPMIALPVGLLGVRATAVECVAAADGSGSVKLLGGTTALAPFDGESTVSLSAGQTLTYSHFSTISAPVIRR